MQTKVDNAVDQIDEVLEQYRMISRKRTDVQAKQQSSKNCSLLMA